MPCRKPTVTMTVWSSLYSGWWPEAGSTMARRSWAKKLLPMTWIPLQSGPRWRSLRRQGRTTEVISERQNFWCFKSMSAKVVTLLRKKPKTAKGKRKEPQRHQGRGDWRCGASRNSLVTKTRQKPTTGSSHDQQELQRCKDFPSLLCRSINHPRPKFGRSV